MTTNYDRAREALDELQTKRGDLMAEHEQGDAKRPHVIAQLNQDIRDASARARTYASLAIADAIADAAVLR